MGRPVVRCPPGQHLWFPTVGQAIATPAGSSCGLRELGTKLGTKLGLQVRAGVEWPGSEKGSQDKSGLSGPSLRLACSVVARPGAGQEAGALLPASL